MMKPMLGLSLHVSMPTCVQVLGVCADAGAAKISAASTVAAIRMAFITIDLLFLCECSLQNNVITGDANCPKGHA
jgi:hypothetical protein